MKKILVMRRTLFKNKLLLFLAFLVLFFGIRLLHQLQPQSQVRSNYLDAEWPYEQDDTRLIDGAWNGQQTKNVLLWTKFFGADWEDHLKANHGSEFVYLDESKRCRFTTDRHYLKNASSIVFHGRDIDFHDIPSFRSPLQHWIFFSHESPDYSGFGDWDWQRASKAQFNWTMTYSKLADVRIPYGVFRRASKSLTVKDHVDKIKQFMYSFQGRPKDAVWIVSNCETRSIRERYVKALREIGISVDIFGKCGASSPENEWRTLGERIFFLRYRFIFAFENSLCEDYVTEKAFHAFYANYIAGAIPILYSGANYSEFFPSGSYIDMRSFHKIKDLAKHMKQLADPKFANQLLSYYDWQEKVNPLFENGVELDAQSDRFNFHSSKRSSWRSLCRSLWTKSNSTEPITDLKSRLGSCVAADTAPLIGWAVK